MDVKKIHMEIKKFVQFVEKQHVKFVEKNIHVIAIWINYVIFMNKKLKYKENQLVIYKKEIWKVVYCNRARYNSLTYDGPTLHSPPSEPLSLYHIEALSDKYIQRVLEKALNPLTELGKMLYEA